MVGVMEVAKVRMGFEGGVEVEVVAVMEVAKVTMGGLRWGDGGHLER